MLTAAPGSRRVSAASLAPTALAILAMGGAVAVVVNLLLHTATSGSDLGAVLVPARALFHGAAPAPVDFVNYGAATFVVYLPLVVLPDWLVTPLTQVGDVALVAWVLWAWGGADGERPSPWLAALLLSAPTMELVCIDQVNAAIALASLSLAIFLMIRSDRMVPGALLAVTAICRPLNAAVALPALAFQHRRRRSLPATAVWAAVFVAAAAAVAWSWDHSLAADLLGTAAHRPLVGTAGFARDLLGSWGLLASLAVFAALATALARRLEASHSAADIAAIVLALSVIPVQLGGPYTAIYCFPLLARLAGRSHARGWVVGFSALYAVVIQINSTLSATLPASSELRQLMNVLYIFSPVFAAIVGVYCLARVPGPGLTPHALRPTACSQEGAGAVGRHEP